ncbi:MAG: multidrug effflux MFS transporter [Bacteroidales bacterium]|nr:multidrug effflux MFS transporter [Bacteroidales bacterium]
MKKNRLLMIVLGNLTAFGPFVTDFYLPCFKKLTEDFAASASIVQMSLTAGMVGLALGQLLIGPLADKYGRRSPLLWCMALFVLSTAGCMVSTNITMFILFRLLQGCAGSAGLVISKTIVSDSFTGLEMAKYFAILGAVQGAAPIFAPALGGVVFNVSSWHWVFAVLGIWGIILYFLCHTLRESLPPEQRLTGPIFRTFKGYGSLFRNGKHLVMNLLQAFGTAALMCYISSSPFIFQDHFGLTSLQYSICFACNALGLVIGSVVVMRVENLHRMSLVSVLCILVSAVLVSAALLLGWKFIIFEASLVLLLFGVGALTPLGTTLAMTAVGDHRGAASALLGCTPFLFGGIVAPLTGLGNMLHSTALLLTICALICLTLHLLSLRWDYSLDEK